jgi:hypothetical protein
MANTAANTATAQPADVPSPTKLALGVMQQAIEGALVITRRRRQR